MKYISTLAAVSPSLMNQAEKLAEAGKTPLLSQKMENFLESLQLLM